jgi:SAM-dependent methyltransferase
MSLGGQTGMLDLIENQPSDVPTRETLKFLTSHIPVGANILEVGCGEGQVAGELLRRGYRVTALDSDPEAVGRAQERGVPAVVGSWPQFDGRVSFDAIAFTRSLHHISPLREAIARTCELLDPTGLLLIEDFAFEEADETTIDWFVKVLRSKRGGALINPGAGQLVTELLSSTSVLDAWRNNLWYDVYTSTTMNEAIAEHFVVRETQSVPYLYRYLIPVLAENSEAAAFVNEVFQQELLLGQGGQLVLLGRRIVAAAGEHQTAS